MIGVRCPMSNLRAEFSQKKLLQMIEIKIYIKECYHNHFKMNIFG